MNPEFGGVNILHVSIFETFEDNLMRFFAVLGSLILSYTSALAADGPEIDMANVPRDTVAVYDHDDGAVATIIYRGRQGDVFAVESRRGEGVDAPLNLTYFLDAKGQRKRLITTDNEFTYRPHNCSRTLGRCDFKVKNHNSGKWFDLVRILERDGEGRFAFTLYLSGQIYEQGWYKIGDFGIPSAYKGGSGANAFNGALRSLASPE